MESRGRIAVLVDGFAEHAASGDPVAPAQSTLAIIDTLGQLGYEPEEHRLLAGRTYEWLRGVQAGRYDAAFNLCETIAGVAVGEHLAAAAVEFLGLPMTGARAPTLLTCLDKDLCYGLLRSHGIPVPRWRSVPLDPALDGWSHFPAIVKPRSEDASNGVHPSSVVNSREEYEQIAQGLRERFGRVLVQEFVEGREINLAFVGRYALPPSEIDFTELPDDQPPIVTFEAKWVAGSLEDVGTQPVCPAPLEDDMALTLQQLAARAWSLMGGEGYGRVDIRLSSEGIPYVIDINPNPDLSQDAGLARQAQAAGWSYTELIDAIVTDALERGPCLDVLVTEMPQGEAGADPRPGMIEWVFLRAASTAAGSAR